ncbi:IS66 family transposase [Pseudomonas brassicacearum]|uniref:IS66 family transposase n=1 Tax=Pseudomonas brassicacearum TaxID=930166 RepID=UPI003D2A6A6B
MRHTLFQPLLNLLRDQLLGSRAVHCDEICVQGEKRIWLGANSRSRVWGQTGSLPNKPVVLFGYFISRT